MGAGAVAPAGVTGAAIGGTIDEATTGPQVLHGAGAAQHALQPPRRARRPVYALPQVEHGEQVWQGAWQYGVPQVGVAQHWVGQQF